MSSEAQNAIAEAMDKHRVERWSISNADGFRWWTHCVGCGWESESRTSNAEWEELMHADGVAHLSVEVDKALGGLTRETLPAREGWILPPGWIGDRAAARWVSGWSEA
ncbi:hypothetical protein RitSun_94 [Mycobacterium phage RitSun]|nr:hypothetical protein RitSun_94 [Mycobacterium phage RitSun]